MGIPKFAYFITNRYPLIVRKINNDTDIPIIDNLYLDINGIIHNVSHSNNIVTSCLNKTDEQIYSEIAETINKIVHMINPRKFLMISADGVAPRAKMNQQRSRRINKTTEITTYDIEAIKKLGLDINKRFNSDAISAGTIFMYNLSEFMNTYIKKQKQTDEKWSKIKVLFSGSDVPGEGEHKILEYIRNFKESKEYNEYVKHCIYGLDADLVMLSLITHESNMVILREDKNRFPNKKGKDEPQEEKYLFFLISVLREYLELEFEVLRKNIKFQYNVERIIDDFIFFCFFIGNDFLPNLYGLNIEANALDYIFSFYKKCLPELDDYITFEGKINFESAKKIFNLLAEREKDSLNILLENINEQANKDSDKYNEILFNNMKDIKDNIINQKKLVLFSSLKDKPKSEQVAFKRKKKKEALDYYQTLLNRIAEKESGQGKVKYDLSQELTKFEEDKQNKNPEVIEQIVTNAMVDLFADDEEDEKKKKKGIKKYFKKKNKKDKKEKNSIEAVEVTSGNGNLENNVINPNSNNNDGGNNNEINTINNNTIKENNNKPVQFKIQLNPNNYNAQKDEEISKEIEKKLIITDTSNTSNTSLSPFILRKKFKVDGNSNKIQILTEAEKIRNYLFDEGFASDLRESDIDSEDVGPIDEEEVEREAKERVKEFYTPNSRSEEEDLDKAFQKKLLDYYIKDSQSAKEFYYKEKLHFDISTPEGKQEKIKMFNCYLEGLQWVYSYYYGGVPSWKWFYPYHYAPMISDFIDVQFNSSLSNLSFTLSQPFSPFQSLLFILPKTSFNLLPSCYSSIPKELPELFPEKLKIDYNGRSASWEAIVLLPFADEEKVLEAEKKHRKLTKEEEKYDKWGNSYLYSSNKLNCDNKDIEFSTYEIYQHNNGEKFVFTKDSYNPNKRVDFTFPTFKTHSYDYIYDNKAKIFFGRKSRNTTRIIISPKTNIINRNSIEYFLSNGNIFINYPYKTYCKLVGFIFMGNCFVKRKNLIVTDPSFRARSYPPNDIAYKYYKRGYEIRNPNILCKVVLYKGFDVLGDKGSFRYDNEEMSIVVPYEITSLNSISGDYPRYVKFLYKRMYDYIDETNNSKLKKESNINQNSKTTSKPKMIEVEVTQDYYNNNIINKKTNDTNEKIEEDIKRRNRPNMKKMKNNEFNDYERWTEKEGDNENVDDEINKENNN